MEDTWCQEEEQDKLSDLCVSSTGHWIRVLQCRQRCVGDTATRPGRMFPVPDFLPNQLRKLHETYAQGQLGKSEPLGVLGWKQGSEILSLKVS